MMDDRGTAAFEIIVLLTVIVLAVGLVVNFTEKTTERLEDEIVEDNIAKTANEFVDNIISNPGVPENWERLGNLKNVEVGIGIIDENNRTMANSVSYEKLLSLNANYRQQVDEKTFNNQYKTSLIISPIDSTVPAISSGENINSPLYTVNRIITCDFYKRFTVNDFQTDGKCNSYHITPHACTHFKVFRSWLKTTDYYLLFDTDSYREYRWSISSTQIGDISKSAASDVIYLNPEIEKKTILDTNGAMFIHINQKDAKAVLAGVPKDFDKSKLEYDYFIPKECELTFQIGK